MCSSSAQHRFVRSWRLLVIVARSGCRLWHFCNGGALRSIAGKCFAWLQRLREVFHTSGSSSTGHRRIGSLRSRRTSHSHKPLKLLREPVIHRLSELVRGRISSMGCPSMQCVSARLHQRSDGAPSMACQVRPALLLNVPTGASAGSRLEFMR